MSNDRTIKFGKYYILISNMDFSEALKLLKQGTRVSRASWGRTKCIFLIKGHEDLSLQYIRMLTKDNKSSRYTVTDRYTLTDCDIFAEDWERF